MYGSTSINQEHFRVVLDFVLYFGWDFTRKWARQHIILCTQYLNLALIYVLVNEENGKY